MNRGDNMDRNHRHAHGENEMTDPDNLAEQAQLSTSLLLDRYEKPRSAAGRPGTAGQTPDLECRAVRAELEMGGGGDAAGGW
ncbi:hypothetical protein GCM10010411_74430 [Actinomadura fulvescens]|uniref:Uncharacterized protein n=1 Tax=Actinomadura fulvescens TaxID=46160 RepID=A0ABP6CSR1_9ACTN